MEVTRSLNCPFCTQENAPQAVVCCSCARDIVVPPELIAERDDLLQKRNEARVDLHKAKLALEATKRAKRQRSV